MLKFLKYLIPFLLKHLKFLEKFKNSFFIFIWIKVISYLISFIIKAEKVGFTKMIKIIYWSLSAFNVILALIIILNVTDFDQQLLKIIYHTLKLLVPTIILESISNYYIYFLSGFKILMRKLIKWVYSIDELPQIKKLPNKRKMAADITPEPIYDASILPYIGDDGVYHLKYDFEEEESSNVNWKTITLFVILALGISYYYYPDIYHQLYSNLKNLFSKDGGSSGRGGGGYSGRGGSADITESAKWANRHATKHFTGEAKPSAPYGTTFTEKPFGSDGPTIYSQATSYNPLDPMANLQKRLESIFYSTTHSTQEKNGMIMSILRKSLGDKNLSDLEVMSRNEYFVKIFEGIRNKAENTQSYTGKPVTIGFDALGRVIYNPLAMTPSSADTTPTNSPIVLSPSSADITPTNSPKITTLTPSTTPAISTTNISPLDLNKPSSSIPSGVETITPTLGRVASPQENIPSMPGGLPDSTSRSIYNSPTMPQTRSGIFQISKSATSPVYGSYSTNPINIGSNIAKAASRTVTDLSNMDSSILFDSNGLKRTPVQIMDALIDKSNKK